MEFLILPTINAALNALSGLFLILGWRAIKSSQVSRHKRYMLAAMISSTLFLISYISYHCLKHGVVTRYEKEGILKIIYYFILGTHTPLAIAVVPLSLLAVRYALRENFKAHTKLTKKLLPIWLYVSFTGVLIYLMLYIF